MIKCYVIDDEFHAVEVLSDFINRTPGLELVGSTLNPLIGLDAICSANSPDLTFLDINMPELSGLKFADLAAPYTTIIFTTAYAEHALDAFDKNAFDYLLKPIAYDRFLKSVSRFKGRTVPERNDPNYFYIKGEVKGKLLRIKIEDILYIEGALNYIVIHTTEGKQLTYLTIGEIENYLPSSSFTRIHRSFIVNYAKIKTITGNHITLDDKTILSIGSAYKTAFFDLLEKKSLISKRTGSAS
ncbi:LytR/AlgR family response regulator transcription factor [Mucilaginibacter gilvus]|uniref:Response regulator transcription factor n=1 Tax=Mucilaginibacter gilvus TaxID=2305909 RepID=A0A444MSS0_9SPHI|nr:LytTR family DNA-binding domain-containing protein [Mucilaginibacter gilvus]RWY55658.1 response regulator transcription factor [Mucilaginibacter gilvus]